MKKIIIILVLVLNFYNLYGEKIWVSKYYVKYDEAIGLECFSDQNCISVLNSLARTKVLKSINKGDTWEQIYLFDHNTPSDSIWSFHRVQILDSNNIYIAYQQRIMLQYSSDGGKSFNRITFDTLSAIENDNTVNGDYIRSFKMYNTQVGLLITNKRLVTTTDAWKNYKIIQLNSQQKRVGEPLYFIDSNNIAFNRLHLASNDQLKFSLKDETWEKYNDSIVYGSGEIRKQMYDVFFLPNSDVGYACGGQQFGVGSFTRDIIWKTTNRGKNWDTIFNDIYPETFALTNIYFKDSLNGITTSSYGKIIVTTDGGLNWKYLKPNTILEKNSVGLRGCIVDSFYLVSTFRADIWRYEEDGVSVEDNLFINTSIFPNPSSDKISLDLGDVTVADLVVYDILGNEIMSIPNYTNKSEIDISSLSIGTYTIQIQTSTGSISQRLLVNR